MIADWLSVHFYRVALVVAAVVSIAGSYCSFARADAVAGGYSLELKEAWCSLAGFPDAAPENLPAAGWVATFVPGIWPHGWQGTSYARRLSPEAGESIPCVWYRLFFDVPDTLYRLNAVLRVHRVRWGAKVWLNESYLGEHLGEAPFSLDVPAQLLKQSGNQLIMRLTGWREIPRNAAGQPMIPVGSARFGWGCKLGGILDKVELEFYREVLLDLVRVMPDVEGGKVRVTVWARGEPDRTYPLAAAVRAASGGPAVSAAETQARGDGKPTDFDLLMEKAELWSLDHPFLYRLDLSTDGHGKSVVFGMRDFAIREGHFELNGRRITIRGSNLVHEWLGWDPRNAFDPENVRVYVIDAAKGMNVNAFRTHTQPMPSHWLEVCDAYGMMVLAEFPLCFNYLSYGMTAEEMPRFRAKIEDEFQRLAKELWNHPSVIMWVPTNESAWKTDPYEDTVLYRLFKDLDPSRPVLRSAIPNPDILDAHSAGSYDWAVDATFYTQAERHAMSRDGTRPVGNSEYFSAAEVRRAKHFGPSRPTAPGRASYHTVALHSAQLKVAHHAALQTEALRRLRYDLILPYMYAYWTYGFSWQGKGKMDFGETYCAFRNSLAPLAASLDVDEVPRVAGSEMTLSLHALNDTPERARFRARVVALAEHPGFKAEPIPEEARIVWQGSGEVEANGTWRQDVPWRVPDKDESSYLALLIKPEGGEEVRSIRNVRSVLRDVTPLKGRTVAVLGSESGPGVRAWLGEQQIDVAIFGETTPADVPVVVSQFDPCDAAMQRSLKSHAEKGGTVVVLARENWDLPGLLDAKLVESPGSNAFVTETPGMLVDLSHHDLEHWNTPDGGVFRRPFAELHQDTEVWAVGYSRVRGQPVWRPVAGSLRLGKGKVVLCQLMVEPSLVQGERFDPMAERVLVLLLRGSGPRRKARSGGGFESSTHGLCFSFGHIYASYFQGVAYDLSRSAARECDAARSGSGRD